MSFKNLLLRNEKHLLLTIITLVFIQTLVYSLAAYKGIVPSYNASVVYGSLYILLVVYWSAAKTRGLNASFDKGYFYYAVYPFFIFYSCLKQFGWLKGTGVFVVLFTGVILPHAAYQLIVSVLDKSMM